ncbi:M55 family metallopeptidase [Desnuesiella massiliensis]|uniref:M55 family metallopeptidase n=1 Tax=Desnuesiella massiliensis TaxID=1650662 RepID=UPI0006E17CB0|nr:M55 family metallopeptidase [Desnuesiella massiliensis]
MKLYISLDMEGIAGTFDWRQEEKDRDKVRACIHDQMTWVMEGILKSSRNKDIEEIVIADSHALGDNLLYKFTEIDPRISIISGYPRAQYMMPALDSSYDLVFFIGYHAGVGTPSGAMDHTYSSRRVHKLWINDMAMNESLINAAYAGYYNIPVGLVVGDAALQKELYSEGAMPWVKYVVTKESLGKFSSKLISLGKVKESTINAVAETLDMNFKDLPIYKFNDPIELKIEFNSTAMAEIASLMPYTNRLDGRTISFVHEDYKTIFDALMALVTLASTVNA